jgi:hypothetical protein
MAINARSLLWGLAVLAAATVIGAITFVGWEAVLGPRRRPTSDRKFPVTAERLARGKFLVEGRAPASTVTQSTTSRRPPIPW